MDGEPLTMTPFLEWLGAWPGNRERGARAGCPGAPVPAKSCQPQGTSDPRQLGARWSEAGGFRCRRTGGSRSRSAGERAGHGRRCPYTGCKWRAPPKDFLLVTWNYVPQDAARILRHPHAVTGVVGQIRDQLRKRARRDVGRSPGAFATIVVAPARPDRPMPAAGASPASRRHRDDCHWLTCGTVQGGDQVMPIDLPDSARPISHAAFSSRRSASVIRRDHPNPVMTPHQHGRDPDGPTTGWGSARSLPGRALPRNTLPCSSACGTQLPASCTAAVAWARSTTSPPEPC